MRQELIRRRLKQTSQDGEGHELNMTSESVSTEDKLAAATKKEVAALAEQSSKELSHDVLLDRVPRDSNGELTSIGSLKHEDNACSPCLFWKQHRCKKGMLCEFCHMEQHRNEKVKSIRASKSTRERQKALAERAARLLVHVRASSVEAQPLEHAAVTVPSAAAATGAEGGASHPARRTGNLIRL